MLKLVGYGDTLYLVSGGIWRHTISGGTHNIWWGWATHYSDGGGMTTHYYDLPCGCRAKRHSWWDWVTHYIWAIRHSWWDRAAHYFWCGGEALYLVGWRYAISGQANAKAKWFSSELQVCTLL